MTNDMTIARMWLDIEPEGQARARATSVGGQARLYTPARTRAYQRTIAALAWPHRPEEPIAGPVAVEIVATFRRPAYMSRRSRRTGLPLGGYPEGEIPHTRTPDADNVAKAVLDALSDWWGDDAQVIDLRVRKAWAALDEAGGLGITVRTVEGHEWSLRAEYHGDASTVNCSEVD